jgi:hypothetical protein
MIKLDFQPSIAWSASCSDPDTADLGDLRYCIFLGDVVLKIDDQDFSALWGWIPLLDFSISLVCMLRNLPDSGIEVYEFTESVAELRLTMAKSSVEVTCNYADAIAQVAYDDFRQEAERYGSAVFDAAVTSIPGLARNPSFLTLRANLEG